MKNPKKIKKQYVFEIEATEYLHELLLKEFTIYAHTYEQLYKENKKGMDNIVLKVDSSIVDVELAIELMRLKEAK